MASAIKRFLRATTGVAAIEMAIAAPLLILLLLGGVDITRLIMFHGKIDKMAFTVADITAQYETLGAAALRQVFSASSEIVPEYRSGENGVTMISSVYLNASNVPTLSWQCASSPGTRWASKIGTTGRRAAIPADLLTDARDNLIVTETWFRFEPMFLTIFDAGFDIYSKSMFRPRLGSLTTNPCAT